MSDAYECDNCGRFFDRADFLSPVNRITFKEASRYRAGYRTPTGQKDWTQEVEMWCNRCTATINVRNA